MMGTDKEIISYAQLILAEKINVQRGMNYRPAKKNYSIFLMSAREDSLYNDTFNKEEQILYYEGEDISKIEKDAPKNMTNQCSISQVI